MNTYRKQYNSYYLVISPVLEVRYNPSFRISFFIEGVGSFYVRKSMKASGILNILTTYVLRRKNI